MKTPKTGYYWVKTDSDNYQRKTIARIYYLKGGGIGVHMLEHGAAMQVETFEQFTGLKIIKRIAA